MPDNPAPKDDFEEDAEEDANLYIGDRKAERARREHRAARDAIKAENELRKKTGRPLLPLPRAPKRQRDPEPPKKRPKGGGSDEEEEVEEGRK